MEIHTYMYIEREREREREREGKREGEREREREREGERERGWYFFVPCRKFGTRTRVSIVPGFSVGRSTN